MESKTITIDGIDYAPIENIGEGEKLRIVIVDNRGLTFVGMCDPQAEGDWMTIRDAHCIIRWGTTRHIAEIAPRPTDNTLLGEKGTVVVRRKSIIAYYDCGCGWPS